MFLRQQTQIWDEGNAFYISSSLTLVLGNSRVYQDLTPTEGKQCGGMFTDGLCEMERTFKVI